MLDVMLFPRMALPLLVHEESAQQVVDEAMAGHRLIGLLASKTSDLKAPHEPDELYDVGTVASILKMARQLRMLIHG